MTRLLYQIHRWVGVALALFMAIWFSSGLVIMYASPSALGRAAQLAGAEPVQPEYGWLSLGEAWQRSAAQRRAAEAGKEAPIADARLVRQGGTPRWLVDDTLGRRFALSATDGQLARISVNDAQAIARQWAGPGAAILYVDTGIQDSAVRNHETLRPFHRFAVGSGSRELLVSARSGEVVRDSTRLDRALYWSGNWIHLMRPLETAGLSADGRRSVLAWLGFLAFAASLTGLIIGWQRWRPGWGSRPTYSQGRVHPYRDVWNTWHFWSGLLGGSFALLWALSGYLNNNPFNLFSPAAPNRAELARYLGTEVPAPMLDWRPSAFVTEIENRDIVEIALRRVGREVQILGVNRDGLSTPLPGSGNTTRFSDTALVAAAARLVDAAPVLSHGLLDTYDDYYYARHNQGAVERPLPVLQVELADPGHTRVYLDPRDGRVILRQDDSRRAYRWLWSALHHWDLETLRQRPVWDAWMLTWVLLGLVLGYSAAVLGWKRLRRTLQPGKPGKASKAAPVRPAKAEPAPPRLARDGQTP